MIMIIIIVNICSFKNVATSASSTHNHAHKKILFLFIRVDTKSIELQVGYRVAGGICDLLLAYNEFLYY